jgi:TonB family protein
MNKWLGWLTLAVMVSACASSSRPLQFVSGGGAKYPPAAKADGVEGYVVVRYDVDVDGTVKNAKVVEAEPPGIFDAAAIAAIQTYRFNAPMVDGASAPVEDLTSKFVFELGEKDEYPR